MFGWKKRLIWSYVTYIFRENKKINPRYGELLHQIQNKIDIDGYSTAVQTDKRNILRIGNDVICYIDP